MTLGEWLRDTQDRIRRDGIDGAVKSGYQFYVGILRRLEPYLSIGTPIYDDKWDVLMILDACRYDLMCEVANEYEFISEVGRRKSVGSSSSKWMERNFRPEYADEMARTVHVTGNPFSDQYLDGSDFRVLDEVWRYAWDDARGTVLARPITDRAIASWREVNPDRMIIHYMQPHYPFIRNADLHQGMNRENFADSDTKTFWEVVEDGDIEEEMAWKANLDNLRYVLDEVEFFLRTIDADSVVITADHGNAIGKLGVYGHPGDVYLSVLREVPWIETSATADIDYEPMLQVELPNADSEEEVEERLRDLGYL